MESQEKTRNWSAAGAQKEISTQKQKENLEQSTKDYKPLHQDNISKFSKGKNVTHKVESNLRKKSRLKGGIFFQSVN